MATTARTIVVDALQEIRVVSAVEAVSAEDLAFGLRQLNTLLDAWNAEDHAVYADLISTFTLTASLQPHTIGPTGATWTATPRPQRLDAVNLVISDVRYPLEIIQSAEWMAIAVPELTSTIPSRVFYNPTWPNGKLYFHPVPSAAYEVELLSRVVLGALVEADTFTLPPGYRKAVQLSLAEDLVGPMRVEMPPLLPMRAQKARAVIFEANSETPRMSNDFGGGGGWYNYLSGLVE